MEPPGEVGWIVTGDKTMEFSRFPLDFVKSRIEKHNSAVFVARVLNKPTVFVTSSQGLCEMLVDKSSSFCMAYKDFGYMHALHGDIVIFNEDAIAERTQGLLREIFAHDKCMHYAMHIDSITDKKLCNLNGQSIDVYEKVKDAVTSICLSVFLDLDYNECDDFKQICTTHWHGLTSVPLNLKFKGFTSSYGKAEEARQRLLNVISEKLSSENKGHFLQSINERGLNETSVVNHILLFISSVIPKALSSSITSFVIELAGDKMQDVRKEALDNDSFLDDILLEIHRLYPALYGGRRITREPVIIDGYKIPADTFVAYITKFANIDSKVFGDPTTFLPKRWQRANKNDRDRVWTFGGGKRACIGTNFVNRIIKHIATYLLKSYNWTIDSTDLPVYKTLPVTRPKNPVLVHFEKK